MKKFDIDELTVLSEAELVECVGGSAAPTSFWYDVSYLGGMVVKGLVIFGTQGGRNAGLCVK